ncbi:MAG: class I SAM-dependent methyltransferase [Methylococcaceae bacterium]
MQYYTCPICASTALPLDVVDFNKSCEELRHKYLPLSGIAVYYYLCEHCYFCFAPQLYQWKLSEFEKRIYNADYSVIDPDSVDIRPRSNAKNLIHLFANQKQVIRHLDYGGGSGLLSQLLRQEQWQSLSYDPFYNKQTLIKELGQFNLITAYEVFEHVPDIETLMTNLSLLLAEDGVILFSTLLSDGQLDKNKRIQWWYAAPRNGHISLFSKTSLLIMAKRWGFTLGSFSTGFHAMWKVVPSWASHIIK